MIIESSQIGSFKIYDGTGRLIQSGDIAAGRTLIDNLASGIFIIKIQIGNEVKQVKIEKL